MDNVWLLISGYMYVLFHMRNENGVIQQNNVRINTLSCYSYDNILLKFTYQGTLFVSVCIFERFRIYGKRIICFYSDTSEEVVICEPLYNREK